LVLYTEIPLSEKWLFDNKKILKKVEEGLEDAAAGRLVEKSSFAQYADGDIE